MANQVTSSVLNSNINLIFQKVKHSLLKPDVQRLARATDGYSGADIVRIMKGASGRKMKKMLTAKYASQTEEGEWFPCASGFPGAKKLTKIGQTTQLKPPLISLMDLELSFVKKTVLETDLRVFSKFEEDCRKD